MLHPDAWTADTMLSCIEEVQGVCSVGQQQASVLGDHGCSQPVLVDLEQIFQVSSCQFHSHDDIAGDRPDSLDFEEVGMLELLNDLEGADLASSRLLPGTGEEFHGNTLLGSSLCFPDLAEGARTEAPDQAIAADGLCTTLWNRETWHGNLLLPRNGYKGPIFFPLTS
jgi:hypothetical protein